jgi:hypothetical protein
MGDHPAHIVRRALEARLKLSTRDSVIQVAQIRVKRRAAQRTHLAMRKRAAQELNPEMGRMGAEDPSRGFRLASIGTA